MFFVCKNMFKVPDFPMYNTVFSAQMALKTAAYLIYQRSLEKKT
jgi:hypothetical protein